MKRSVKTACEMGVKVEGLADDYDCDRDDTTRCRENSLKVIFKQGAL